MNERTIRLSRDRYDMMLRVAAERLPEEACGLLGGEILDGVYEVRKIYVLENIDHSPEHFSMDPREQLDAVKDMRKRGIKPLGNWHSHPSTPSRPSDEDKRLAFDKNAVYMILSFAEEEPVLNAFHIENTSSGKDDLIITK